MIEPSKETKELFRLVVGGENPTNNTPVQGKQVCPECDLTHIRLNQKLKKYKCYDCSALFDTPAQRITRPYTWAKRPNPKRLIVPKIGALRQAILSMDTSSEEGRVAQAFCTSVYLSVGRVSESLQFKSKSWNGLTKEHITIEQDPDLGQTLVFNNILVLKRRDGDDQKSIGIPIKSEPELCQIIIDYIQNMKPNDVLFPFNRQKGWNLVKNHLKIPNLTFYPHLLRHIRLTHLNTEYGYDEGALRTAAGWTDGRPASIYTHLGWKDNAKRLLKK